MNLSWRQNDLPLLVASLANRPGHEAVRTRLAELLRHGFGIDYDALDHEVRMPEVRGRADTLFGATVFEFKANLEREIGDVQARLPVYLAERERLTQRRFLGIATDGALFIAYELRDGRMVELSRHSPRADRADALLAWLEPAVSDRDDLLAEPITIQRELGRDSLSYSRARGVLERLWAAHGSHPEVQLKRELWDGLLREVYGTAVGDDGLFLQHTYLTIVAKTIAARVLDLPVTDAAAILSGQALADAGIIGAVESDFFDWVLVDPDGADLVRRVARQTARFRLREVQVDVLKALYESLIDPAQRHDLGEYYTPDWLAAKVTRAAQTAPLTQRVLDPACGSGTFLFHAIRALMQAAGAAGWDTPRILSACAEQVRGLDVHPVAVIIARVTWLLALGPAITQRRGNLHVPVFLGDALQWNLSRVGDAAEIVVSVPQDQPLRIPAGFAEDQAKFEPGLQTLSNGLRENATPAAIERAMLRMTGVSAMDAASMATTFAQLQALYRAGRDGIWPYVLRNLVRPLWLSRPDQRADVLLGNPPWVAYRHLSAEMKPRLRDACLRMNLWVGGNLATQQDLSALFWARSALFYLRPGGTIAFVLPYAALNRPAFAGLRVGNFRDVAVRITAAWSFDERVRPLFPVPACVLIGRRETPVPLPTVVERYAGVLPRRDANEADADRVLTHAPAPWPPMPLLVVGSPYRSRFKQGAIIVPRRFFIVEAEAAGRLGGNPESPIMRGKRGAQDKVPWRDVEPPRGPVESEFLRPVLLGEGLAPFRLLQPALAVIPIEGNAILDAKAAADTGYRHLAAWLSDIEKKWRANCTKQADGTPRMSLHQQIDYMRKLSGQLPISQLRLAYAKAGTLPAAAMLDDRFTIVDHKAYWASVRSVSEGRYLTAIINSETARVRIEAMQSKGQGGARDFDNLIWELRIPEYTAQIPLHRALAEAAAIAEQVAAGVELTQGAYFTTSRRAIRDALAADGIAARIDRLVARLLDGPP